MKFIMIEQGPDQIGVNVDVNAIVSIRADEISETTVIELAGGKMLETMVPGKRKREVSLRKEVPEKSPKSKR